MLSHTYSACMHIVFIFRVVADGIVYCCSGIFSLPLPLNQEAETNLTFDRGTIISSLFAKDTISYGCVDTYHHK